MAQWHEIQRDFSGGEVGGRVTMRDDAEFHAKSVRLMYNFMPTLQGTARRTPGPKFVYDVGSLNARIIPYLAPDNSRAIIQLLPQVGATPGTAKMIANASGVLETGGLPTSTTGIQDINPNPQFRLGLVGWDADPIEYTGAQGDTLGVTIASANAINMAARVWKSSDVATVTMSSQATVPEDTTLLYIQVKARYTANFSGVTGTDGYSFFYKVGTTPGANDVWEREFNWEVGYTDQESPFLISGLNITAGTVLYLTVELVAKSPVPAKPGDNPSSPLFTLFTFRVRSTKTFDIGEGDITGDVPYTASELPDVQYVQSPYVNSSGLVGKELVLVHPNHHPLEIVFTAGAYTIREKPFTPELPSNLWGESTGYPSCCASFHGRLILGGGRDDPLIGSGTGSPTETVVGTHVGNWNLFDAETEVDPDDSIEFSTIYRSPIQWVFGQKDLLIGALEMEYVASADGIFQPADLGVFMHSTHGSNNVQPAGMGDTVVFAADGGKRVRSMNYQQDDEGWVAPDLTILHPTLCKPGIRRMVRMRNPHQMVVVLLNNGICVILHQDRQAGVSGWSRMSLQTPIKDICVIANEQGEDVLFATVRRLIDGVQVLYLEAFSDWTIDEDWQYLQSSVNFSLPAPTNVLTDLEHLEGKLVEVIGDGNYLGVHTVEGGSITLLDQLGEPLEVTTAIVGLSMLARIWTLPMITDDPGAKKRYSDVTVRLNQSARPKINGTRPKDRTPINPMGTSEPLDGQKDHQIQNVAWSTLSYVTIEENLPLKVEVIGIFGKFIGNSV